MKRTTNATRVMAMVEHPYIKPWLPPLTLDKMRAYLQDPRTIAFADGEVGAVFEWSAPGVYECHVFMLLRGRAAINAGRRLAGIMLNQFGARMLWGEIDMKNRHTRWFSRQVGFHSLGIEQRAGGRKELFVLEAADAA